MIRVLIDTSEKALAVGIADERGIIDAIAYDAWQRQSERLILELNTLLKRNEVDRKDIASITIAKGPGSYTGVRIALTVGKVMAFALGAKLYLVSSLEALKIPTSPTICVMNARSGRSYVGVYDGNKVLLPDTILNNEALLEYVNSHQDYRIAGDSSYLGLRSENEKTLQNLLLLSDEKHLEKDVLSAKPVYLKDLH